MLKLLPNMWTDRTARLALAGVAVSVAMLTSGCRLEGETSNADTKIQYVPDMADAPTSKPQKSYLDPPEGAVAMSALPYPKTPEEAEKVLQMPPRIAQDPGTAAAGAKLYETFCRVCHGPDAKGKGSLGPNFPMPPDITFGSAIMPSYGHAITPVERWQIIRHLRTLQGAK